MFAPNDAVRPFRGPQYLMGYDELENFNEEQAIYREITVTAPPLDWKYRNVDRPTLRSDYDTIKEFVEDIAIRGYTRNALDREEIKELDIPVYRNSYIIIELAPQAGLTFSSKTEFPAVTLGSPDTAYPEKTYGHLRYVDSTGRSHESPQVGCRLVYFAARYREGTDVVPHLQSLNYNVVTKDGDATVVDPDVRHPGEGGI